MDHIPVEGSRRYLIISELREAGIAPTPAQRKRVAPGIRRWLSGKTIPDLAARDELYYDVDYLDWPSDQKKHSSRLYLSRSAEQDGRKRGIRPSEMLGLLLYAYDELLQFSENAGWPWRPGFVWDLADSDSLDTTGPRSTGDILAELDDMSAPHLLVREWCPPDRRPSGSGVYRREAVLPGHMRPGAYIEYVTGRSVPPSGPDRPAYWRRLQGTYYRCER
jgi:hypothetical protein